MNEQKLSMTITGAIEEIGRLQQERDELGSRLKQLRQERDELLRQLNSIKGFYARVDHGSWRVREWTQITSLDELLGLLAQGYVVHVQAGPPAPGSDTSGQKEPPA